MHILDMSGLLMDKFNYCNMNCIDCWSFLPQSVQVSQSDTGDNQSMVTGCFSARITTAVMQKTMIFSWVTMKSMVLQTGTIVEDP